MRSVVLLGVLLGSCVGLSTVARGTTAVRVDETTLVAQSAAVVIGTVERIRTSERPSTNAIRTDITLVIDDVVAGRLNGDRVVLREIGGHLADRTEWLFGNPEYLVGEHVLVFLERAANRHWRTTSMALGKFTIYTGANGRRMAMRSFAAGTTLYDPGSGQLVDEPLPDVLELDALLTSIRAAALNGGGGQSPSAIATDSNDESDDANAEGTAAFTFLNPSVPARWFEPDDGTPVGYLIDQTGDAKLGLTASRAAVDSALAAWTDVAASSLSLVDGGLTQPSPYAGCNGPNHIVFNDPYGEVTDPSGCGGILAVGGYCRSNVTRTVNGVSFNQIVVGKLVFNNGFQDCPGWNSCAVAEVATHELGHTIGLGHSADTDATMYATAHFDGRCASLRQDDEDAVTFIYPASTGPPPTPSTTPTRTDTRTPSATPTTTTTPLPTDTRTASRTPSHTATRTATGSPTNSRTPSSTATITNTPLASATPSDTPIPPPTSTPSDTPARTSTKTPSNTRTPSSTATITNSPLPSATRTDTPTRRPTATSSATPAATATRTPSNTRTASFTAPPTSSPVPSATATASPAPSLTPSPSSTRTASLTPSATRTPSYTATATSSPIATPTPTETVSPLPTRTPSETPTHTATDTSTTPPTSTATAAVTATFTHIPTAVPTASTTPTVTRTASPARTPTASRTATDAPPPSPTRTASTTPSATRAASLTPMSTDTAAPNPTATLTATEPPADTATPTPTSFPATPRNPPASPTSTALPSGEIIGRVAYYRSGQPIANVALTAAAATSTSTNADGTYTFPALSPGTTRLTLFKQGDARGVVTAADAVALLQALHHERVLEAGEKSACDVDGNHRLDRRDAEQILDLAIGAREHFDRAVACRSDWLFLPNPERVGYPLDNSLMRPDCSTASIDVSSGSVRQDFAGILIGDCNGSGRDDAASDTPLATPATAQARVGVGRRARARGMQLPLVISATAPYTTAEIHIDLDSQSVRPVRVRTRSHRSHLLVRFHIGGTGALTIAVASPVPIPAEGPLTLIIDLAPRDRAAAVRIPAPVPRVRVAG